MAKILIAGGDYATRDILQLTVEGDGHEVVTADDGLSAQELALTELPDLIILEAAMPIFNGFETCEALRNDPEIPPTLPILILTSEDVDVRKLESVGATDSLSKDGMSVQLSETLVNLLGDKAR